MFGLTCTLAPSYSAPVYGGGFSPTLLQPTSPMSLSPMGGLDQRFMMMQQLQVMEQMLEMMEMMLGGGGFLGQSMGMPGLNGPTGLTPGGFASGGFPGSALGPALSCSPGGGSAPVSGPVPTGPVGAGAQGSVDLARRYLGRDSQSIKGQMPHFTAAGGQTNNCADFVSSSLESTGRLQGHFVNVRGLEDALKRQGWRQVPASQARPGDVWMNHSRGHTELVTAAGGTRAIGSNNDRPGHQVISEKGLDPSSGVYYTKG